MEGPLAKVNAVRCVGCGICVIACSMDALGLVRRPEEEVLRVPVNHTEWGAQRAAARGL
jgi:ferredoxin